MKLKLSHIAIASQQINKVVEKLSAIGLIASDTHNIETEKVKTAMLFVQASKHLCIEVLEPTSEDSVVSKFLSKRPSGGIHHICFEVENIQDCYNKLLSHGFKIIEPGIRKAARGKAFFIHPSDMGGVLVEFEQIL